MTKRSAEQLEVLANQVEHWADTVAPSELSEVPVAALRAIAAIGQTVGEAQAALAAAVAQARRDGYSWVQIATALGVSGEAAQARFGEILSH